MQIGINLIGKRERERETHSKPEILTFQFFGWIKILDRKSKASVWLGFWSNFLISLNIVKINFIKFLQKFYLFPNGQDNVWLPSLKVTCVLLLIIWIWKQEKIDGRMPMEATIGFVSRAEFYLEACVDHEQADHPSVLVDKVTWTGKKGTVKWRRVMKKVTRVNESCAESTRSWRRRRERRRGRKRKTRSAEGLGNNTILRWNTEGGRDDEQEKEEWRDQRTRKTRSSRSRTRILGKKFITKSFFSQCC